jgi:DNA-binding beta-propeller fold protein YncE
MARRVADNGEAAPMTREKIFQALAALGIGAAIAAGAGCGPGANGGPGGGGNPPPTPAIPADIYYVNTGETANRVTAQSSAPIVSGGIPSPLPGSPFATGQNGTTGAPFGIALAKGGTVLYAANSNSNNVTAFTVAANGTLTTIATTGVTGGTAPSGICVNPLSTLAAVVDTSGAVDTFTINGAGALVNAHTANGLNTPVTCAFSQDGAHVYVTSAAGIYGYSIDAAGNLASTLGSPYNMPNGFQGIATSSVAVFAASLTTSALGVFLINADGSLSFQQFAPVAAAPYGVALTPSGNAVYIACAGLRAVDGFSVNGVALNRLAGAPYPTQANKSAYVSVSSAGNLLVVLDELDLAVTLFAINSDGTLGFAPTNIYGIGVPAGANPAAVVAR